MFTVLCCIVIILVAIIIIGGCIWYLLDSNNTAFDYVFLVLIFICSCLFGGFTIVALSDAIKTL